MLTIEQVATYTAAALAYIQANPLSSQQELRAHLSTIIGAENDWRYVPEIILQEVVLLAQRKAYAEADKAARDAYEARIQADAEARMEIPVDAAPVLGTTITPEAPKTLQDHVEALKVAYSGTDPEFPTYNLQAACRYGLLNGLSVDTVASTINRPYSECRESMFPG